MIYPWQQSQWTLITKLLDTERLPHAMMMLGSEGLGKADFADTLANAVLCQKPEADHRPCGNCKSCQLLKAGTHPDLHRYVPTPPPTSKSANPVLSIRIDDIRELCNTLNQTSQYGAYRVALIEQADCLNVAAANSLLKTLEEPGQNVLILLVTSRPHRLPVTIRSRCQVLRFSKPDDDLALDWLHKNSEAQNSPEQVQQTFKQALRQAHGSPLTALRFLQEVEHQQLLTEAMTAKISGKNTLEYAAKLAKFNKIPTLEGMLSWTTDLSRILACGAETEVVNEQQRSKLQVMAKKVNQQRLFRFYDQLNFNLSHSSIALNEQLLWENLLLSWDNL